MKLAIACNCGGDRKRDKITLALKENVRTSKRQNTLVYWIENMEFASCFWLSEIAKGGE